MTEQFASALLYTEAERERDRAEQRKRDSKALTRKLAAPRGSYGKRPTEYTKARDLRIMGESR